MAQTQATAGASLVVVDSPPVVETVHLALFPSPTTQESNPVSSSPSEKAAISLTVAGPETRTVGETAEFNIKLANTSSEVVKDVKLTSTVDASLDPSEATLGYQCDGESIVWTIESLPPGRTEEFKLKARCVSPSGHAGYRVKVTSGAKTLAEKEVCG